MNDKQYGAWLLDLASYFINNQNYQMITLSRANDEIWLVNPANKTAPLVLITTKKSQNYDDDAILKQRETLAVVFQTSPRGINISVNRESDRFDEHNVSVGPDFKSPSEILEQFEAIEFVLKNAKNVDYSFTKSLISLKRTIAKKQGIKQKPLYASLGLSAVMVVFYVLAKFFLNSINSYDLAYIVLGGFYKPLVVEGLELWRFITSAFLTMDLFELILGLMILRNAGKLIEPTVGWWKFLWLFFLGVFFGNLMLFITNDAPLGAGIITGICTLLGYILVIVYEIKAYRNQRIMGQVISLGIIIFLYVSLPTISNYGLVGSFFLGLLLGFQGTKRKDWQTIRNVLKYAIVIFVLGMIAIALLHTSYEMESTILNAMVGVYEYFDLGWYANHLRLIFS